MTHLLLVEVVVRLPVRVLQSLDLRNTEIAVWLQFTISRCRADQEVLDANFELTSDREAAFKGCVQLVVRANGADGIVFVTW